MFYWSRLRLWKIKFSTNATGLTIGITIGKICTNGLCDKVPVPNRDKVPVESATKCPWITYSFHRFFHKRGLSGWF